jgi:hypothetical protein
LKEYGWGARKVIFQKNLEWEDRVMETKMNLENNPAGSLVAEHRLPERYLLLMKRQADLMDGRGKIRTGFSSGGLLIFSKPMRTGAITGRRRRFSGRFPASKRKRGGLRVPERRE